VIGLDELLIKDLLKLGIEGRQFVNKNFDRKTQATKLVRIIETVY